MITLLNGAPESCSFFQVLENFSLLAFTVINSCPSSSSITFQSLIALYESQEKEMQDHQGAGTSK